MIYLDIETENFFGDPEIKSLPRDQQIAAMRFGCAVTYRTTTGGWCNFRAEHVINLYNHLCWCGEPVVGWNIIDFDKPVIVHSAKRAGWRVLEIEHETIEMLDLFAEIRHCTGRWYSLETIAQANLARGKLADGQRAAEWLRSGDPVQIAKAFEYCRHDVQLVIDLHAILLRGEPLRLPPRAQRQEINEVLFWLDGAHGVRTEWVPDALGSLSIR